MRRYMLTALLAVLSLVALATAAHASTISVEGLAGTELPNIEAQGRLTFEETFGRIICDMTIKGRLRATATGTLGLGANAAGEISEIRFERCEGGLWEAGLTHLPENTLGLSWVRASPESLELGGITRILWEDPFGTCQYQALTRFTSTADASRTFTRLELRLINFRLIARIEGMCQSGETFRLIAQFTITRPAAGIRLRLA